MRKLTISDFSGGIQEATGAGDFTPRQWSQLKGVVPESEVSFVTQWAAQKIGTGTTGFRAVYPLASPSGTFLVGIKADGQPDEGTLWWCKVPSSSATYTTTEAVTWTQLTTAENVGVKVGDNDAVDQPTISITANPDFRFICSLPLEIYKYDVAPTNGTATNFSTDVINTDTPRSVVTGVLIHSRRYKSAGSYTAVSAQQAVVAYVDPTASSGAGVVKAITFPNWRRMPQNAGAFLGVKDYNNNTTLFDGYPQTSGIPSAKMNHHAYTYLDANGTLLPGRGVIPRGNVGCMWGGILVLGDVEWRSDKAAAANNVIVGDNTAYFSIDDDNTAPYRSYIYYSESDIDLGDPRSYIRVGTSDTTVVGLHVLDNTLIAITSSGGEGDGVISFRGQLSELHPYSGAPNPFAIRREIIRGSLGSVQPDETAQGHRSVSCVWPEAGVVVFVDRLGGIWYTDGDKCDRLDRFGPKPPTTATANDHVAAMGKHLFVWRNSRLLLFSLVASSGDEASGCWTELVAPAEGVTGLVGSGEEMFFVSNGVAWRYTMNGPDAERGRLHNVATDITVSTATLGDEDEHKRKNWHRYGMTFEALSNAEVRTIRVQASGALNYTTAPATYTSTLNRAYSNGYSSFVVPAGIGAQVIASATVTFRGYVRLQEASFWTTGEEPKR